MLPSVYAQGDGFSFVARQPETPAERHRAMMALVACPTGSIGTVSRASAAAAVASFPEPVTDDVFFCGFTSERSFGAWSYLIRRPEGNVLVDSPRAAAPLMKRIAALGGVATMVLTHRDDVADHAAFRKAFKAERVIHRDDGAALGGDAERLIDGREPVEILPGLVAIPTPGHTKGHVVYLFRNEVLFTATTSPTRRGAATSSASATLVGGRGRSRSVDGAAARPRLHPRPPRPRRALPHRLPRRDAPRGRALRGVMRRR